MSKPVSFRDEVKSGQLLTSFDRNPIVTKSGARMKCACGAVVLLSADEDQAVCPSCKATVRTFIPATRKGIRNGA